MFWTIASILFFVLTARAALIHFSWSRLEKLCLPCRPGFLTTVREQDEPTLTALRAWVWLLVIALVTYQGAERPMGVEMGLALWLSLVAADLWVAQPLGRVIAEPLLYYCWPILVGLRRAMYPIYGLERATNWLFERLAGRVDKNPPIQDEILSVVNEGAREGELLVENAAEMIEGLMDLHQVPVSAIMTPRPDMVMLRGDATVAEASRVIGESGHSRIPIFGNSRDDVLGILYARDLLPHLGLPSAARLDLRALDLRAPFTVPEEMPVDALLRELRRARVHMALVLNDYGGVAGMVTLEDILAEIVGEIADETRPPHAPLLRWLSEEVLEVDARIRVDEFNAETGLQLPDRDDYDSLAGFILNELGRVPRVGETIILADVDFTVEASTDRSVRRLRVVLPRKSPKNDLEPPRAIANGASAPLC